MSVCLRVGAGGLGGGGEDITQGHEETLGVKDCLGCCTGVYMHMLQSSYAL